MIFIFLTLPCDSSGVYNRMTAELIPVEYSKLIYKGKPIPYIIYQGSIWVQVEVAVCANPRYTGSGYFEDDDKQGWTHTKICRISNLAPEQIKKTGYVMG